MATATQPRRLIPFLAPFYEWVEPYTYLLMRVIVGLTIVPHGWGKISGGFAGFAAGLAKRGWEPATVLTGAVTFTEFFAGIMVAIGFLTRFAAGAMAIELAIITFTSHWMNGFFWTNRGWEYPFMWGILSLAIALKGGGRFSVDRLLGWEL